MAVYVLKMKNTVILDVSGRGEFQVRVIREGVTIENPWIWTGKPSDFLDAATVHCSDYERQVAAVTPYVANAEFTITV